MQCGPFSKLRAMLPMRMEGLNFPLDILVNEMLQGDV